jgi:hypothetical protein
VARWSTPERSARFWRTLTTPSSCGYTTRSRWAVCCHVPPECAHTLFLQTPTKLYLVMDMITGGELFFHLKNDRRFTEDRAR